MSIYDIEHLLPHGQFIAEKTQKVGVCIHFTAGSHDPIAVIDAWAANAERIGAHAVIGRTSRKGDTKYNGKIVKAIDSDFSAWHLGIKAQFDVLNKPHGYYDKRYLGIEVCTYGPLTLKDGKFLTYVNSEIPADQVCDLGEGNEYRGFRYYHAPTAEQLQSLCRLTAYYAHVCGFEIERGRVFTVADFRYDIGFANSKTVTFHTNWRADKTDWPPIPAVIDALNALHADPASFYTPTTKK
jgi:hypothetical protein